MLRVRAKLGTTMRNPDANRALNPVRNAIAAIES